MSRLAAATLVAAALAGCVAERPIAENQACPCAPGWKCDDGQQVCVQDACYAACDTKAGPLATLATIADVYAALAGQWRTCSLRSVSNVPSDVIGVEFGPASSEPAMYGTVGGNAYFVVSGPSGPVHGAGFDYQLTYEVDSTLRLSATNPRDGFGGSVDFSPCPREVLIHLEYPLGDLVLVPFPGT